MRAERLGVFLYFVWSFHDFVPTLESLGMAGGPRSQPWRVDSGPGEGGFGEGPGGPRTLYKFIYFIAIQTSKNKGVLLASSRCRIACRGGSTAAAGTIFVHGSAPSLGGRAREGD